MNAQPSGEPQHAPTEQPPTGQHQRPGWRGWITWKRLVLVGVLLVAGFYGFQRFYPNNIDDGFIAFEPDSSLFPTAPVADAATVVGTGQPDSWHSGPELCPYGVAKTTTTGVRSEFGNDWRTARHDWVEDGTDKSWIISERTTGFTDLDEFDRFLDGFRDTIRYCGWQYGFSSHGDYNSILTDLDGLPAGSIAFTVDASPDVPSRERLGESDPDDFSALSAVLPGHKRGQVMYVTWIGWGVDVPADEFVAAANRLYDAAHEAERPTYDDDATIEFDFTDTYPFTRLLGATSSGDLFSLYSARCHTTFLQDDFRSLTQRDHASVAIEENDSRSVLFAAARWERRAEYLEAKHELARTAAPLCIDSMQKPALLIEPITLPGLPDGAVAAVWHDSRDEYVVFVSDDDRQLAMIIAWNERGAPVPNDLFVEVVNDSWQQFQANNP